MKHVHPYVAWAAESGGAGAAGVAARAAGAAAAQARLDTFLAAVESAAPPAQEADASKSRRGGGGSSSRRRSGAPSTTASGFRRAPATEDDAIHALTCTRCHSGHADAAMVLCDGEGCEAGYHTFCLTPPLPGIPEGDWLCPCCAPPASTTPTLSLADFHAADADARPRVLGTATLAGGGGAGDGEVEAIFWEVVESGDRPADTLAALGGEVPQSATCSTDQAPCPWLPRHLAADPGNALRHAPVRAGPPGATRAALDAGITFTASPWAPPPLPRAASLHYHAAGAPIRWYVVPAAAAKAYLNAVAAAAADAGGRRPSMLPPRALQAAGVPVYALTQTPVSVVLVLPGAVAAAVHLGPTVGERGALATAAGLADALAPRAAPLWTDTTSPPALPLDALLLGAARNAGLPPAAARAVARALRPLAADESGGRLAAWAAGVTRVEREAVDAATGPPCTHCGGAAWSSRVECGGCGRCTCGRCARVRGPLACGCAPKSARLVWRVSVANLEGALGELEGRVGAVSDADADATDAPPPPPPPPPATAPNGTTSDATKPPRAPSPLPDAGRKRARPSRAAAAAAAKRIAATADVRPAPATPPPPHGAAFSPPLDDSDVDADALDGFTALASLGGSSAAGGADALADTAAAPPPSVDEGAVLAALMAERDAWLADVEAATGARAAAPRRATVDALRAAGARVAWAPAAVADDRMTTTLTSLDDAAEWDDEVTALAAAPRPDAAAVAAVCARVDAAGGRPPVATPALDTLRAAAAESSAWRQRAAGLEAGVAPTLQALEEAVAAGRRLTLAEPGVDAMEARTAAARAASSRLAALLDVPAEQEEEEEEKGGDAGDCTSPPPPPTRRASKRRRASDAGTTDGDAESEGGDDGAADGDGDAPAASDDDDNDAPLRGADVRPPAADLAAALAAADAVGVALPEADAARAALATAVTVADRVAAAATARVPRADAATLLADIDALPVRTPGAPALRAAAARAAAWDEAAAALTVSSKTPLRALRAAAATAAALRVAPDHEDALATEVRRREWVEGARKLLAARPPVASLVELLAGAEAAAAGDSAHAATARERMTRCVEWSARAAPVAASIAAAAAGAGPRVPLADVQTLSEAAGEAGAEPEGEAELDAFLADAVDVEEKAAAALARRRGDPDAEPPLLSDVQALADRTSRFGIEVPSAGELAEAARAAADWQASAPARVAAATAAGDDASLDALAAEAVALGVATPAAATLAGRAAAAAWAHDVRTALSDAAATKPSRAALAALADRGAALGDAADGDAAARLAAAIAALDAWTERAAACVPPDISSALAAATADARRALDPSSATAPRRDDRHCVCRTRETAGDGPMVACDGCGGWYHAACVSAAPADLAADTWTCPLCASCASGGVPTSVPAPAGGRAAADGGGAPVFDEGAAAALSAERAALPAIPDGRDALDNVLQEAATWRDTVDGALAADDAAAGEDGSDDARLPACCLSALAKAAAAAPLAGASARAATALAALAASHAVAAIEAAMARDGDGDGSDSEEDDDDDAGSRARARAARREAETFASAVARADSAAAAAAAAGLHATSTALAASSARARVAGAWLAAARAVTTALGAVARAGRSPVDAAALTAVAAALADAAPAPPARPAAAEAVGEALAEAAATYCVCRGLFHPARAMVACDTCGTWCHADCVGKTVDGDDSGDDDGDDGEWVCPVCTVKGGGTYAPPLPPAVAAALAATPSYDALPPPPPPTDQQVAAHGAAADAAAAGALDAAAAVLRLAAGGGGGSGAAPPAPPADEGADDVVDFDMEDLAGDDGGGGSDDDVALAVPADE